MKITKKTVAGQRAEDTVAEDDENDEVEAVDESAMLDTSA